MKGHLRYGVCLFESLQYAEALKSFEKALSIDSTAPGLKSWIQKVQISCINLVFFLALFSTIVSGGKASKALENEAAYVKPGETAAAPVAEKHLMCKRFGCAATFLESSNTSSSCLYHEGPAEYKHLPCPLLQQFPSHL